jgi:hypothetical protein
MSKKSGISAKSIEAYTNKIMNMKKRPKTGEGSEYHRDMVAKYGALSLPARWAMEED